VKILVGEGSCAGEGGRRKYSLAAKLFEVAAGRRKHKKVVCIE
jgi:hypothetical protein